MPTPLLATLVSSVELAQVFSFLFLVGAVVFLPASIAISAMYFKHRQRQAWHETARLALEKGQPLPPMPGAHVADAIKAARADGAPARRRRSDLTGGLVMIAIGAAVYLGLHNMPWKGVLIGAYVPAFIGVALLLNVLLDAIFFRKSDDAGARPPQT